MITEIHCTVMRSDGYLKKINAVPNKSTRSLFTVTEVYGSVARVRISNGGEGFYELFLYKFIGTFQHLT